jgi:hypothetical protein
MSSTGVKGLQQTNKKTEKGFKYRELKSAEVCPGLAHQTVRCIRDSNSELLTFDNSRSQSAIIHRTVRWRTGLSGVPAEQRLLQRQRSPATAFNALQCAQKSGSRQKAHRRVYRTCPVHHRTVRWPRRQKLQRSESNGWVTWLAHRTVSGGAPDSVRCAMRQQPPPNGKFGGWGYKYPNHPTIHCIQVFRLSTPYKSSRLHSKTQTKRSNPLPSPKIIPIK